MGSGGVLPGLAGATEKKFEDKSPSGFLRLFLFLSFILLCVLPVAHMNESFKTAYVIGLEL